jgi:septal ring factor EnvC (AmiA/AmiB activator)
MEDKTIVDQEMDNFFSLDSEDGDSQEETTDVDTEVEETEADEQEEETTEEQEDDNKFTPEKENKMLKKQKESLKNKVSKYEQEIAKLKELNEKYESGEMTHEELVQRAISKYKIETMQDQEIGKSSEKY